MSYHSEVARMQKIVTMLTEQIDNFMDITYTQQELLDIIDHYFPEGIIALSQGVDLIIVLEDLKTLFIRMPASIEEDDFDKIKKAIIDHRYDKKFHF